jgi:hypothetical protein
VLPRCFLIGAGASRAVGQTFGRDIPTNDSFFKILASASPTNFLNLQRIVESQFGVADLRTATLEQVEDYVEQVASIFRTRLDSELKRAVHMLLGQVPETSRYGVLEGLVAGADVPNLQLYYLLLENAAPRDFFVSLNYDILFDLAILAKRKSIYCGRPMLRNYTPGYPSKKDSPIPLFKPHGSLNWDSSGAIQDSVVAFDRMNIATRLTVANNPALLDIWSEARAYLDNANDLVVIGSSLSMQDQNLMSLLKSWTSRRETTTEIIYSGTAEKTHYEKLFENYPGKLVLYSEGFSERSLAFIFS